MPIVRHLIADTFGSHIGKYSQRLKVTQKKTTLAKAPLLHLESVHILSRGVSISSDALEACCDRGIPVYFLNATGQPYASLYASGLTGTVLTRRAQLRAYDDERGVQIARSIAAAKIENQSRTLRYLAKLRKDTPDGDELHLSALDVRDYLAELDTLCAEQIDSIRNDLMSIEAHAAKIYWRAARLVVPADYNWTRREGRGARDPVNSLLNYGYGILYSTIERALVQAGLDPYGGFIHADRPGKPSLTLDLIEPFRQTAVDRVVFGLVARNFAVEQDDRGQMSDSTRRQFADHILKRLDTKIRYRGKQYPLQQIIQADARHLAAFLRGETGAFTPFLTRW